MNNSHIYEIRVEGSISENWSEWLGGMTLYPNPSGQTIIRGLLMDQSALLGVLTKVHSLNLKIISVKKLKKRSVSD